MAIISKLILGSAILSSLALAAPVRTVTETDYITLDTTTTIYIDDSKTMSGGFQPTFAAPSIPTSVSVATSSMTSTPAPAVVAPTSTATTSSAAAFYTQPISTSTSSAAAATSSASLAKNGGTGAPSSASDTASCQGEGAACVGDITYYDGGLGACGVNVDPAGNGIALPYEFMGTASNSNPYCGKTLTIYNPATGQTVQATVMDKCMGCTGRAIDLTQSLFSTLTNGDIGAGRVSGVDWWFN